MDIEYPVKCPLMNGKDVEMDTCFDIHMVVLGEAPRRTAPEEIFEHNNFKDICNNCKYHKEV